MNIYCAANELDLINFSGAGFSRKLGTYDDSLSRCSIALPGGSGSAISIDTLDITEGDLGIHFCLATTSVEEEPVITDFIRIEDVLSNKTSVLLKRLEDDTITIQLNTNTADGTPAPSSQKLQFSGLRHFDLFLSYNSGTDETTLQLYVDSLLSNTVTESGSIIYPTKIGFNSASNSTYYISQIVVSDELARNIRVKTLVPVDNGYYTAWTNDYKKVYDIEVNDSETIIASEEGIQESYLVSVPNGDLYFNNVFVLHHFEDTVDSSYSKNNLLIQGSAALSATSPIMGSKSLYIPQVVESFAWIEGSDSLTFDDNDLCIEILVKFEDISTDAVILSQGTLDGPLWRLKRESNNTIVFLATNLSATDPFPVVLTSTDLANEIGVQYTLRVTRQGDVWTLYMDGSIQQSVMWAGSVQTQNQNLILGTTIDYANQMFGYMDEFRLTIGQSREDIGSVSQADPWPDKQQMLETPPADWGSIVGVSVNARCRRADFGDISMLVRRNGTDLVSDLVQADTVFSGRGAFFPVDPVTSLPWEYSDLLSTEIGVNSGDSIAAPANYYVLQLLLDTQDLTDSSPNAFSITLEGDPINYVSRDSGYCIEVPTWCGLSVLNTEPNYGSMQVDTEDFVISVDVYINNDNNTVEIGPGSPGYGIADTKMFISGEFNGAGKVKYVLSYNEATVLQLETTTGIVTPNAWHTVRIERVSGEISLLVDSVVYDTGTYASAIDNLAGTLAASTSESNPTEPVRFDNFFMQVIPN